MKHILMIVTAVLLTTQGSISAQASDYEPVNPIAYTPDATKVIQTSLTQSTELLAPVGMVFTEYKMALQYFYGICSYLESETAAMSPEGMAYLNLPQTGNPMCGYARMKGTRALTAVTKWSIR